MAKNISALIKNNNLLREAWYFFSAALVLAVILEMVWPNIILVYFNLNILFIFWFICGILLLFRK
jgi:hypothetical protein